MDTTFSGNTTMLINREAQVLGAIATEPVEARPELAAVEPGQEAIGYTLDGRHPPERVRRLACASSGVKGNLTAPASGERLAISTFPDRPTPPTRPSTSSRIATPRCGWQERTAPPIQPAASERRAARRPASRT
jgi:hypothetical protein